jgi:glycerol uptake facilitator-like aquaporin
MKFNLRARLTAEFLGSAFLVAAVIGSGIMGERLAGEGHKQCCRAFQL